VKRPKILLVSANTETIPAPVYPAALPILAAAASEAGWDSTQFDANLHGLDSLPESIAAERPDAVGVSIRNIDNTDSTDAASYLDSHIRTTSLIRRRTGAPLIVGGSGFSIFPDEIMRLTGADYGVRGAGASALAGLLSDLAAGIDVPRGLIAPTPAAAGNAFVAPLHDGDMVLHYYETGGMIGIQSKIGCPRQCSYCTYPLIEGRSVVCRDPGAIVDEMEHLAGDLGVRYFFFVDSAFNISREHEEETARLIEKRGLDVSWGAFFTPRGLSREYLHTLKRGGLTHVELGVDSLSDAMLASYRKGFSAAEAVEACRACGEEGVHCAAYLIFGGRGETKETVHETLRAAEALDSTVFFPFTGVRIYPGTRLFEEAVADGVVERDADFIEPRFYFARSFKEDRCWEVVRSRVAGKRNWILPEDYSGFAPLVAYLRRMGRKGPLWENLLSGGGDVESLKKAAEMLGGAGNVR
jgi:radical SAM superfamily enzyme YgiQ (UPF0313 family)